jgi:hypothetical protein
MKIMPQETWAPSPNFHISTRKKIAIVYHITAGLFPGCLNWLRNPVSQASVQYLVCRTGAIYQLVKEANEAWHAGEVNRPSWALYDGSNPNYYCLGIEHEGFDGTLTEAQYQSSLALTRELISKYGIPADNNHLIGHYRIDSVRRPNCPGPRFPWARLFADLTPRQVVPIPAPAPMAPPAPVIVPAHMMTVTARPYLNVRSGASTKYAIIGRANYGSKVRIGWVKGGWANIYFGAHGGFVSSQYLK